MCYYKILALQSQVQSLLTENQQLKSEINSQKVLLSNLFSVVDDITATEGARDEMAETIIDFFSPFVFS